MFECWHCHCITSTKTMLKLDCQGVFATYGIWHFFFLMERQDLGKLPLLGGNPWDSWLVTRPMFEGSSALWKGHKCTWVVCSQWGLPVLGLWKGCCRRGMLCCLHGHPGDKGTILSPHTAAFQEQRPFGVTSSGLGRRWLSTYCPFNKHFREIEANSFSCCLYLSEVSTANHPFSGGASCWCVHCRLPWGLWVFCSKHKWAGKSGRKYS